MPCPECLLAPPLSEAELDESWENARRHLDEAADFEFGPRPPEWD